MGYFTDSATQIMGIVNLTADSFSDGGKFSSLNRAIARAEYLVDEGATIIDVGAESTRPGAVRATEEFELAQLIPVVTELAKIFTAQGIQISVDTMRAKVAQESITAGATIINDVSGGLADPDMKTVIKDSGADIVLMHWDNPPTVTQNLGGEVLQAAKKFSGDKSTNIVERVIAGLQDRIAEFTAGGVKPEQIIVDPGLGFSKSAMESWELVANIAKLQVLNKRILVGASRKKFLTAVTQDSDNPVWPARDIVTATISQIMAVQNIWAVRVHDFVGKLG